LGVMNEYGQGMPQNYGRAFEYYRAAARAGFFAGQYRLGTMYVAGIATMQDYVQAHKWFNLAAASRWNTDQAFRNRIVLARDELARKMTPSQVAEAQQLAKDWKEGKN
jgi:uncharacterized protein